MKEKNDNFEKRQKESRAAMKAFFKLSEFWFLSKSQQIALLGLSGINQNEWLDGWLTNRTGEPATDEQLQRINYLIDIKYSLDTLFRNHKLSGPWTDKEMLVADCWLHSPTKVKGFQGQSPLDYMTTEGKDGINFVRDYLITQTS